EVETTIAQKSAQLEQARKRLATEPEERVHLMTQPNTRLAAIQGKIDDLEYQREVLLQDYKPTHARVRTLDGLLAEMRRRLAQEGAFHKAVVYERNPGRDRLEGEIAGLESELHALSTQKAILPQ